jgi:hypothetical protein
LSSIPELPRPRVRDAVLLSVMLLALVVLQHRQERGATPVPASAPANLFSAERAHVQLALLLGNGAPHPVGTSSHDAVRDRIAARFRELGYSVDLQQRFACSPFAVCAPVTNVIARRPEEHRGHAVMLTAHYDSQPQAPGASDDGMGVAALLEIARAVRHEPSHNPLLFVVTDGEEIALLGAEAFVADPTLRHEPAVIINVENRGTSGASNLFETSRNNRLLIAHAAHSMPQPHASSLFYSVYELLPNDTDLSVYKREGMQGLNFAAIGDVWRYHTPLDDLAHASPFTLQHHGDHVLGVARELAAADLSKEANGNAIYFDVFSFFMITWPYTFTIAFALFATLLAIASALVAIRRGSHLSDVAIAFGAFFLAVIVAGLGGFVLMKLAAAVRAPQVIWYAEPALLIAALWMAGLASSFAAARLLRRDDVDAAYAGSAIAWSVIGLLLASLLRGGSYLGIIPAATFALCVLIRRNPLRSGVVSAAVTLLITSALFMPLGLVLYDALGNPVAPGLPIVAALLGSSIAPVISRSRMAWSSSLALVVIACALSVVAALRPQWNAERPLPLDFTYLRAANGTTSWVATDMLPSIRAAAPFAQHQRTDTPWLLHAPTLWMAAAPPLPIAPVSLRIVSDSDVAGKRRIVVEVESHRNAQRVNLYVGSDARLDALAIDGVTPPVEARARARGLAAGWHSVITYAPRMNVELIFASHAAVQCIAADSTIGVPAIAARLLAARDGAHAVPIHDGERTGTLTRLASF